MATTRVIVVAAVIVAALGLTCNDWLPTGLLDQVGARGNTDRRDALRVFSLLGPLFGLALLIWRDAIARNVGGIVLGLVSTALSFAIFVAVDVYLSAKATVNHRAAGEITDVHVPDPLLGWRPRPGASGTHREAGSFDVTYEIDAAGFKAVTHRGVPTARLFIFGDSYTFGHGVGNADTYANVIASDYLKHTVHVFNVGVMGYGIVQMYGRFLEIAPELKDGDIVVFAPTSQDLKRNLQDFVFPSKLIFGKRLEFGNRYPVYRDGQLDSVELATPARRFKAALFNGRWTKSVFRFAHSVVMSPATTAEAGDIFDLVRERCLERGAAFSLVFLPQIKERRRGRYEEDVSSFAAPDLMSYFPADPDALDALRFPTDSHWNAAGHAIAARGLVDVLSRAGVLGPAHLK